MTVFVFAFRISAHKLRSCLFMKERNERETKETTIFTCVRSMARKNTNSLRTAERTVRYGWGGGGLA